MRVNGYFLIGLLALFFIFGFAANAQDSNWRYLELEQRMNELEAEVRQEENWRQFELEARRRDQDWRDSFHDLNFEHRDWSGGTLRGGHENLLNDDTWD